MTAGAASGALAGGRFDTDAGEFLQFATFHRHAVNLRFARVVAVADKVEERAVAIQRR